MAQMPEDLAEDIPLVTGIPPRKAQQRTLTQSIKFILIQVFDLESVAGDLTASQH